MLDARAIELPVFYLNRIQDLGALRLLELLVSILRFVIVFLDPGMTLTCHGALRSLGLLLRRQL